MQTGLIDSPRTGTANPAAKTLRAALISRSWIDPHSGQVHSRAFKGILFTVCPHPKQRLLLGYHRSIPTISPVERIAKCVNPKPMPTFPLTFGFNATESSQSMETRYRPVKSLEIIAVVSFAALGRVHDHLIFSGSFIFSSFRDLPSHLKALDVYSAECLPYLRLNDGYLARLAKKLPNAVCRWRSDCCTGTLGALFSHSNSGSFFNFVNKEEVA
ncbi:hypothetical protein SAMN05216419_10733 [Nitrosomonas cryotolerans]|nr:hypothetical protein SAMN05216419_10733 [Nitrosomonas cryotolerans]